MTEPATDHHAPASTPPSACTGSRPIRTNAAARSSGRDGAVTAIVALPNTTDEGPRRRFMVRPSDYQLAERRAAELGGELLGFYIRIRTTPRGRRNTTSTTRGRRSRTSSWRSRRRRRRRHDRVVSAGRSFTLRRGQSQSWRKFSSRPRSGRTRISRTQSTPSGATVGELLADLTTKHAGLKAHLYNDQGKLRSFVNIYVNDEDIRYLQKEQTAVKPGDTVSIIPSVAGGAPTTADDARHRVGLTQSCPASAGPDGRELPELTNEEIKRYSRHLIMPEVGVDAQRKLKAAKVLCIGAGGLGSPAAMYLAAAGVGTLGIVDFDTVDFSNLQRQILHGTPDVGRSKLASAKDRLNAHQPEREDRDRTRPRCRRRTRWSCSRPTTSSSTAPTIFRPAIS